MSSSVIASTAGMGVTSRLYKKFLVMLINSILSPRSYQTVLQRKRLQLKSFWLTKMIWWMSASLETSFRSSEFTGPSQPGFKRTEPVSTQCIRPTWTWNLLSTIIRKRYSPIMSLDKTRTRLSTLKGILSSFRHSPRTLEFMRSSLGALLPFYLV